MAYQGVSASSVCCDCHLGAGVETAHRSLSECLNDLLPSAAADGLRTAMENATKSLYPVWNDFSKAHHLLYVATVTCTCIRSYVYACMQVCLPQLFVQVDYWGSVLAYSKTPGLQ